MLAGDSAVNAERARVDDERAKIPVEKGLEVRIIPKSNQKL